MGVLLFFFLSLVSIIGAIIGIRKKVKHNIDNYTDVNADSEAWN